MALVDRLTSGFKAHLAAQVVFTVSNAALLIVFTRYLLSPTEYGLLNLALSVVGVAAIFGNLGLPKSTARYVTSYAETDPGQVPKILSRTFTYLLVLLVVASVAFAALAPTIARLVETPALLPLLLAGVGYVGFYSLYQYAVVVFQGLNRVTWSSAIRVVLSVSRLVFAVVFVLLGFGALGALLGYVVGFALAGVFGIVILYTRFYTRFDHDDTLEAGLSTRILRYSVPLTATRSANVLDKKVDVILVGALVNPLAVSYYALAKQISGFLSMPAASLGFTISPALAEQKAGDETERARHLYEQSLEHILLLYVPAAVGLALVARPMIRLVFGAAYLGAVPVVQIFAAYVLVDTVNQITSDGLDYLGRANTRAVAKGVTALGNVGLNLLLIPTYGATGAAFATVITYSIYTGVNVYAIHSELGLHARRIAGHTGVVIAIAAAMALPVFVLLPRVSGFLTLAGVVALGGGVWAGLATATGHLDIRHVASYLTSSTHD